MAALAILAMCMVSILTPLAGTVSAGPDLGITDCPDFQRWADSMLAHGFENFVLARNLAVAAMAAVTVYSGVEYSYRAFRVLRRPGTT